MNTWIVSPSKIEGNLRTPPSKSQSIRALVFGMMAEGKTLIHNLLPSPDVEAMIEACRLMGAGVDRFQDHLEITGVDGKINGAKDVIHAGNSGLVYRFISGIASLSRFPIIITGDESIRCKRPIKPLLEALRQLGAKAFSAREEGGAPVIISGPINAGQTTLCGKDSQPVSALLISCAFASAPVEIFVTEPGEKPWVNLTLSWFDRLGIKYTAHNFESYSLKGNSSIKGFEYTVPGDFSSMAFPLVAALITQSELQIESLDFSDPQGDKLLISYLQQMGANIEIDADKNKIKVGKCSRLKGVRLNVNDCIDAVPILAAAGCFAEGKTTLVGAAIARQKESDRLSSIVKELKKMGANIEQHEDGLTVHASSLKGVTVHSHFDHRIALALAVAGFGAIGETVIEEISCAEKTYPDFCKHMQALGAKCKTI